MFKNKRVLYSPLILPYSSHEEVAYFMTRRDIRHSLSFVKETMSMLLGRNPMKCQSRRDRERKIDKLSFITKYNEISQGASERRRLGGWKRKINEIPLKYSIISLFSLRGEKKNGFHIHLYFILWCVISCKSKITSLFYKTVFYAVFHLF